MDSIMYRLSSCRLCSWIIVRERLGHYEDGAIEVIELGDHCDHQSDHSLQCHSHCPVHERMLSRHRAPVALRGERRSAAMTSSSALQRRRPKNIAAVTDCVHQSLISRTWFTGPAPGTRQTTDLLWPAPPLYPVSVELWLRDGLASTSVVYEGQKYEEHFYMQTHSLPVPIETTTRKKHRPRCS